GGIRVVFAGSHQTLSPQAARLCRLLGLHPGPACSTAGAASLAGIPPDQATPLLAELTRAHLITEPAPGRYTFHDLLRAYANEQACAHDTAYQRHEVILRMLDHYLHTALAAGRLLQPRRDSICPAPPQEKVTPVAF